MKRNHKIMIYHPHLCLYFYSHLLMFRRYFCFHLLPLCHLKWSATIFHCDFFSFSILFSFSSFLHFILPANIRQQLQDELHHRNPKSIRFLTQFSSLSTHDHQASLPYEDVVQRELVWQKLIHPCPSLPPFSHLRLNEHK